MNKDDADTKLAIGETWRMFKESLLGDKILGELKKIQEQAIAKSLRGDTPESVNVYMESRGKYAVVTQLNSLFADIEADYTNAINWMATNTPVTEQAPVDTASTKAE